MNIKKPVFSISISAIIVFFALFVAMLSGCNRDIDVIADGPEYVFIPEFTSISALAGDLPNVSNIIIVDNTIFLTSTSDMNESLFQTTRIFRINLDESEITHLSSYITPTPTSDQNIGGGVFISAMHVDSDGNLWIAETESHTFFDFPANFDADNAELYEIWEHLASTESSYAIRKLDSMGTELLSVDISALAFSIQDWSGINAFNVDADGNLFIGSGQTISVLDVEGNTLFRLETEIFVQENSLIKMPDGAIAHSGWDSNFHSLRLHLIDIQSSAWGEVIGLPENTRSIFSGNDEFLIFIDDGRNLSGIANDTGTIIPILDWIGSGVDPIGIDNVSILPDDRIMLTITVFDDSGDDLAVLRHTELIVLNRTPYDELDDVTIITVATSSPFIFNSAVLEFNRTNPMYRIEFLEIEFGATWFDDVERLALEIIAGRGPDIIHTSGFPFPQWARHGVFVDLYDFLDSDPSLDRSDFIESVLRSAEIDGRLYQIFPDFNIMTLFGHPDVVGENRGWNFEEFRTVIENNPQATHPLGTAFNAERLLQSIYLNNIESFVNWDSGTVYFDSDFFIEVLEFTYIFNTMADIGEEEGYLEFEPYRMISSGEQIMLATGFFGFDFYSLYQDLFRGDFVFKGFPSEYGSGNFLSTSSGLAILNSSYNQQVAWEFISNVMSDEWQRKNTHFSIPISNVVFEEALANAMVVEVDEYGESIESVGFAGLRTWRRPLTEEHVDNIRAFVDSASVMMLFEDPLWDVIIWEVAEDFLNGVHSAQDAARIIQNRAERFVAEQMS